MSEVIAGDACPCCGDIALPKWYSASRPNEQAPYGLESEARFYYECRECGLRTKDYQTQKSALDAWNTRYEPTCTMDVDESGYMHCSNCGQEMDFYDCGCGLGEYVYEHQRCFNCGAKVVES